MCLIINDTNSDANRSRSKTKSLNPKEGKPSTALKSSKPAANDLAADSTTIKALVSPRNVKSETSEPTSGLVKNPLEVEQSISGGVASPTKTLSKSKILYHS